MPPKQRGKSATIANVDWENGLTSAEVNEEEWKMHLTMIVPIKYDDYFLLDTLAEWIKTGKPIRRLFQIFSYDDLVKQITDLANPKGKRPKEMPQFVEVCDAAKPYLEAGQEIPPPLMAKLIKFKLLQIKTNDQKRREAEKSAAEGGDVSKAGKGKKGAEKKSANDKKKAGSAKKGNQKGQQGPNDDIPPPKEGTKLKKRGEEDLENKYLDDEPDDGAHQYVFFYKFQNPYLLQLLEEIGVHVNCVLRVVSKEWKLPGSDDDEFDLPVAAQSVAQSQFLPLPQSQLQRQLSQSQMGTVIIESALGDSQPGGLHVPGELNLTPAQKARIEFQQKREKVSEKLFVFWRDIRLLLHQVSPRSKLHDLPILEYEAKPDLLTPIDGDEKAAKLLFVTDTFEDIAVLSYNLLDLKRQYSNYRANMRLLRVPIVIAPGELEREMTTMTAGTGTGTGTGTGRAAQSSPRADRGSAQPAENITPIVDALIAPQVDMKRYNELLHSVPEESVSVELILHCMLEQVSHAAQEQQPDTQKPQDARVGTAQVLGDYIASKLASSVVAGDSASASNISSAVVTPIPTPNAALDDELRFVHPADDVTLRTGFLPQPANFDAAKAETSMLQLHEPFRKIFTQYKADDLKEENRREFELRARLQQFLNFVTNNDQLTQVAIDRAFRQFVLECLPLSEPTVSTVCAQTQDLAPESASGQLYNRLAYRSVWSDPNCAVRNFRARSVSRRSSRNHVSLVEDDADGHRSRSAPGSAQKTILRNPSRSPSAKSSRRSSVKFEKAAVEKSFRDEPVDPFDKTRPVTPPKINAGELLRAISAEHKRNLDEWCFAERLDSSTLLQTLRDARYENNVIETFYDARDRNLVIAMHNPHDERLLQSSTSWQCWLHCDCGFRNYLEHVAAYITEWTKQEEAKYEAEQLKVELDRQRAEEAEAAARKADSAKAGDKKTARGKTPARGRSTSGNRAGSRGGSKGNSRDSSAARSSGDEEDKALFIREESLKAWKAKQDEIRRQQEEDERKKEDKGKGKSGAKGRASSSGKKPGSATARSPARGDADAGSKKDDDAKQPTQLGADASYVTQTEPFWPFTGYDIGDQMVHVYGCTTELYPTDGGVISVEGTDYLNGTLFVRAAVRKDGHVFSVHVIDPVKTVMQRFEQTFADVQPPASNDNQTDRSVSASSSRDSQAASFFGSFTARLNDGITLSLSAYGRSGMPDDITRPTPAPPAVVAPLPTAGETVEEPKKPVASAVAAASPRSKAGKRKPSAERERERERERADSGGEDSVRSVSADSVAQSAHSSAKPVDTEQPQLQVQREPTAMPSERPTTTVSKQPFQQLLVSCPSGVIVTYKIEADHSYDQQTRLMVELSSTSEGVSVLDEKLRIVRSDGSVVCHKLDGLLHVMFPDGTVSVRCDYEYLINKTSVLDPDAALSPEIQALIQAESAPKEQTTPAKKGRAAKPAKQTVQHQEPVKAPVKLVCWVTTAPDGSRVVTVTEEEQNLSCVMKARSVATLRASDPSTGQSLLTRDDGVSILFFPSGKSVAQHADGTCITRDPAHPALQAQASPYQRQPTFASTFTSASAANEKRAVVMVEHSHYPSVLFETVSGACKTEFPTGTQLLLTTDGSYDVCTANGGHLFIDPSSTARYVPRTRLQTAYLQRVRGAYSFSTNTDVICAAEDDDRNEFYVHVDGTCEVLTQQPNPASRTEVHDHVLQVQEDESVREREQLVYYRQHRPRFFVVDEQGNGVELLRYQDVAEYLVTAETDPNAAIVREKLDGGPAEAVTVMRPVGRSVHDVWRKHQYKLRSLVPPGLRSRDLKTLPADEVQHAMELKRQEQVSPAAGGLELEPPRKVISRASQHPTRSPKENPRTFEVRQFVQYEPLNNSIRSQLQSSLGEFLEHLERCSEQRKLMHFEADDSNNMAHELANSNVVRLLHAKRLQVEHNAGVMYEETITSRRAKDAAAGLTSDMSRTSQSTSNRSETTEADIDAEVDLQIGLRKAPRGRANPNVERLLRELAEEKRTKEELKTRELPNYFSFELGKQFLHSQVPDLDQLAAGLALMQRQDDADHDSRLSFSPHNGSVRGEVSGNQSESNPALASESEPASRVDEYEHEREREREVEPAGAPDELEYRADEADARSHRSVTPRSSCQVCEGQTAYVQADVLPYEHHTHSRHYCDKHLFMNLTGDPRKVPVRPPGYLSGGRPNAVPNSKFMAVDDVTRSKVNMACFVGLPSDRREKLKNMRGFELLPTEIDFGAVCEGRMYATDIIMKNVGMDTCNFRIKQPPPSTGLRVLYDPRPVAAGLKVNLQLQLLGIAIGVVGDSGIGTLAHHIEIITETDIMRLPIKASILTRNLFDQLNPQPELNPRIREVPYDADMAKSVGVRDLRRSSRPQAQSELVIE